MCVMTVYSRLCANNTSDHNSMALTNCGSRWILRISQNCVINWRITVKLTIGTVFQCMSPQNEHYYFVTVLICLHLLS